MPTICIKTRFCCLIMLECSRIYDVKHDEDYAQITNYIFHVYKNQIVKIKFTVRDERYFKGRRKPFCHVKLYAQAQDQKCDLALSALPPCEAQPCQQDYDHDYQFFCIIPECLEEHAPFRKEKYRGQPVQQEQDAVTQGCICPCSEVFAALCRVNEPHQNHQRGHAVYDDAENHRRAHLCILCEGVLCHVLHLLAENFEQIIGQHNAEIYKSDY